MNVFAHKLHSFVFGECVYLQTSSFHQFIIIYNYIEEVDISVCHLRLEMLEYDRSLTSNNQIASW